MSTPTNRRRAHRSRDRTSTCVSTPAHPRASARNQSQANIAPSSRVYAAAPVAYYPSPPCACNPPNPPTSRDAARLSISTKHVHSQHRYETTLPYATPTAHDFPFTSSRFANTAAARDAFIASAARASASYASLTCCSDTAPNLSVISVVTRSISSIDDAFSRIAPALHFANDASARSFSAFFSVIAAISRCVFSSADLSARMRSSARVCARYTLT
mmetsp:Transcript_8119/g.32453  ORF Transcript_8119/g.32453 Transcript_8119/m.32453 type:complete len:216 (-) Transcript_8119:7-654(-)